MPRVRFNFLNWRPDQDEFNTEGLQVADNLLHDTEGYKQFDFVTTGAFATNTSIGTCPSIVVRPVGTNNQYVAAYLDNRQVAGAGATYDLNIGLLNGYSLSGNYTSVTSATSSADLTGTAFRVSAFEVTELQDRIFVTAEAQLASSTALSGTAVAVVNLTGYMSI